MMNLTRRAAALGGTFLLLAATTATAQQMAAKSDKPVTIRFANYNLASAGLGRDGTLEMLDTFAKANPTVKVEQVAIPAAEVMARIQADVVAGQGPDLAQIIFSDLDYAVANLGAKALEDIAPAAELNAHFAGMFPNGLELGRLGGKTYGLAYVFSTPVLFYNADMFKAAGLNPDAPPATWDELKAAAMAIHKATGKPGLLTGIFGPSAYDWLFQGVILSNGGRVMSPDRKTLTFAEPEAVGAVQMLRSIAEIGAMPNLPSASAIETMASGNAGIYLQTSAVQGALLRGAKDKFDLRAAAMPAFAGKPVKPTNSGSALVIMTRDPAKQRAAWELMKHLTSDYGYTIITSKIGYLPLRPKAIESEEFLAPWIRANPVVKPNIAQLAKLNQWVPHAGPNYRQILSTMMNAAEEATFGKGDVAATLQAAQRRAQSMMPR
jgi:multiple sugar transport system substrate-binding protein